MSANPTNGSWRGFGRGGANVLGTCCLLLLTCCRNSFRIWFSTNLQSCEKEHPKSAFFHLRKFGMQRWFLRSSLFSFFFFFFFVYFLFCKETELTPSSCFFFCARASIKKLTLAKSNPSGSRRISWVVSLKLFCESTKQSLKCWRPMWARTELTSTNDWQRPTKCALQLGITHLSSQSEFLLVGQFLSVFQHKFIHWEQRNDNKRHCNVPCCQFLGKRDKCLWPNMLLCLSLLTGKVREYFILFLDHEVAFWTTVARSKCFLQALQTGNTAKNIISASS